jgi:hypothetical protein
MRGVMVGAALGVLAVKKGGSLVESAMLNVESAISKYVASHAEEGTDQADVPSTDQAARGAPPMSRSGTGAGAAARRPTVDSRAS